MMPDSLPRHRRLLYASCAILILATGLLTHTLCRHHIESKITAAQASKECKTWHKAGFLFPDSVNFASYANNLNQHHTYRDESNRQAWRTPAYSVFLSLFLDGQKQIDASTLRSANLILVLLNICLAFLLGRILFTTPAGFLAAFLIAVYPYFVFFSGLVLAETMAIGAILFLTLFFVLLMKKQEKQEARLIDAVRCGSAAALATLIKPSFALLPVFFLLWFFLCHAKKHFRKTIMLSLTCIVTMLLFLSPWLIRNYITFHKLVPLTTMGGFTLYESIAPSSDGGPNEGKTEFPLQYKQLLKRLPKASPKDAAALELEADALLKQKSFEIIKSDPVRFLKMMPVKFLRTWNVIPNYAGGRSNLYMILSLVSYLPVMLLSFYGLYKTKKRQASFMLFLPACYLALLHSVFMGSVRYRLPAMGPLLVMAAATAVHLFGKYLEHLTTEKREDTH